MDIEEINTAEAICNSFLVAFTGVGRAIVVMNRDDANGIIKEVRIAQYVRKNRALYSEVLGAIFP